MSMSNAMTPSRILNEFHALDSSGRSRIGRTRASAGRGLSRPLSIVHEIGSKVGTAVGASVAGSAEALSDAAASDGDKSRFGWQFWVISTLVLLAVGLIVWKIYQKYTEWREKKKEAQEQEEARGRGWPLGWRLCCWLSQRRTAS